MPLLSDLIEKCKKETLPIFESPEARAISRRYEQLLQMKISHFLILVLFLSACGKSTLDYDSQTHKSAVKYFESNQLDSTVAVLERQTLQLSDSALLVLGLAHYKLGNTEKALNYLKKSVDLNSKFEIGYYNLGLIYDYEDQTELALQNYDRAIKIDPNSKSSIYNKASILFYQNQLLESFKLAKRAIEIDSSYSLPYRLIGEIYNSWNKLDSSLFFHRKLVKVDSSKAEYWFYLGISEEDNGNRSNAIEAYSKSILLEPQSTHGYFNRATMYQRNGDSELAKKDYLKLTQLVPKDLVNYVRLSWIYSNQNKLDSTRTILEKAIAIDSTASEAYFHLGDYYYTSKNNIRACELYRKAAQLKNQRAEERLEQRCYQGENKSS